MFSYFAATEGPHVSIAAEEIFSLFGFPITNSMILGIIGYAFVIGLLFWVGRSVQRGSKNRVVQTVQWAYEGLVNMTHEVIHDQKVARSVAPLALAIFFVLMFNNWLGIVPGVGPLTVGGSENIPVFRGLAADLNFTFGLAIITIVAVQIYAIQQFGALGNLGRYFRNPFKDVVGAFEGILELVGEFSRMVALSMRLFGNVFAGEVLLGVVAFLAGWLGFLPLPLFILLELFVGALQAFVFYLLTIIFLSLALSHDDHGSHDESPQGTIKVTN